MVGAYQGWRYLGSTSNLIHMSIALNTHDCCITVATTASPLSSKPEGPK